MLDGDTIVIGQTHIRIWAIDSPEKGQPCTNSQGQFYHCGQFAAQRLRHELYRAVVTCKPIELDRYGRTVATCQAHGRDIGEVMVASGWAVDYRTYSGGRYAGAQALAKAAKRGLWAGKFEMPSVWRARGGR